MVSNILALLPDLPAGEMEEKVEKQASNFWPYQSNIWPAMPAVFVCPQEVISRWLVASGGHSYTTTKLLALKTIMLNNFIELNSRHLNTFILLKSCKFKAHSLLYETEENSILCQAQSRQIWLNKFALSNSNLLNYYCYLKFTIIVKNELYFHIVRNRFFQFLRFSCITNPLSYFFGVINFYMWKILPKSEQNNAFVWMTHNQSSSYICTLVCKI